MTSPDLEALKTLVELAKKAGAHEWAVDGDDRPGMEWNNFIVQADRRNMTVCFMAHAEGDNSELEAAAEFIAAAKNAIPALERLLAGQREASKKHLYVAALGALINFKCSDGKAISELISEHDYNLLEDRIMEAINIATPPVQEAGRDNAQPIAFLCRHDAQPKIYLADSPVPTEIIGRQQGEPILRFTGCPGFDTPLYDYPPAEAASLGAEAAKELSREIQSAYRKMSERHNEMVELTQAELLDVIIPVLRKHQPIKAGWVSVPREPTGEMIKAAYEVDNAACGTPRYEDLYKAMLSAAPVDTGEPKSP